MKLSLAFSPCPNDTFMFDALVHGRIPLHGIEYQPHLLDIHHLNVAARAGRYDITKISYGALAQVQGEYELLDAGSALGYGCGPLLVAQGPVSPDALARDPRPVAIPGQHTTANLLLSYFAPQLTRRREYLFHDIMPAVQRGEVSAGLIIHESRFVYQRLGLALVQDLGAYWEAQTGLPIPLGAIVAHRRLGGSTIAEVEAQVRASVAYARQHPGESRPYVRAHAQELDDAVTDAHIALYVNEFSLGLGEAGRKAVAELLRVAAETKM